MQFEKYLAGGLDDNEQVYEVEEVDRYVRVLEARVSSLYRALLLVTERCEMSDRLEEYVNGAMADARGK